MTNATESRNSKMHPRGTAIAVVVLGAIGLALVAAPRAQAQTLTTLYSFCSEGGSACTDGEYPQAALVQGSDGSFYGTTPGGGANTWGTVFKITLSRTLTTLYSFCSQPYCADGYYPIAALVKGSDGDFYGTTQNSIFKTTPDGSLTTLATVQYSTLLFQGSDGNFYGMTGGGPYYSYSLYGTIFKITPSGRLTTLYTFCSQGDTCPDGTVPEGFVQGSDGNFYGTTAYGGANVSCPNGVEKVGCGTIFKITPSGALTTLYSFCSQSGCADGGNPQAGLVESIDGSFYGTTRMWGAGGANPGPSLYGGGTVFKITPSGMLTTLYNFCSEIGCADGSTSFAGLVQGNDGNFYGTTWFGGGTGNGTIFKITPSGTLTTLHNFCSRSGCADGGNPSTALVKGNDGDFYGTTYLGGIHNRGTVFSLQVVAGASLSPTTRTLGLTVLGSTSKPQYVTLKNGGTTSLDISSFNITGANAADFADTNNCPASLAPGANCIIAVTFTPSTLGVENTTLLANDSAPDTPQTTGLTGRGVLPASLMPASATYSSLKVGTTSAAKTFDLTNNLTTTLGNLSVSTTGDFALTTTTCGTSLAARSKCTLNVAFTPKSTGNRTGTLSVSDSAGNSPQVSQLSGTGK